MSDKLLLLLKELPASPGVYIMRDAEGKVIYVGKAGVLKNRVRQYFQKSRDVSPKVSLMMTYVADFEWIVTANEIEALILESNLIKKYRPKYNIRLRDDKHYPYLKLTLDETFPRLVMVRSRGHDKAKYFGPYTSSNAMHEMVNVIKTLYPLRTCKKKEPQNNRPCLNFHIGKCLAPCVDNVTQARYADMISEVTDILEGKRDSLIKKLQKKMQQHAEKMEFEEAARIRNQIQAIQQSTSKQKIDLSTEGNWDIIALVREGDEACAQIFFVREGKVVGRKHFFLQGTTEHQNGEILAAFLEQFYTASDEIPSEIVVNTLPIEEHVQLLKSWLSEKRGTKVEIKLAQRGVKAKLLSMVEENAKLMLSVKLARKNKDEIANQALNEIKQAFDLADIPSRIECFDISNIQGTNTVASMVVFVDGKPANDQYRRFQIKTVEGPNDFASMEEVVERRFKHGREEEELIASGELVEEKAKFYPFADLMIIDGGKGQLATAVRQMERYGLDIPIAGLAKREEELFLPGKSTPLILPRDSEGLKMLQRLRDEAHRFAITYHRKKRNAAMTVSMLDGIPGIGKKRRSALLQHFKSIKRIAEASIEDIAQVEGMNKKLAQQLKESIEQVGLGNP